MLPVPGPPWQNTISVIPRWTAVTTMVYDVENRLSTHRSWNNQSIVESRVTYTYDGDGLKRTEIGGGTTPLAWDGEDYLQERT